MSGIPLTTMKILPGLEGPLGTQSLTPQGMGVGGGAAGLAGVSGVAETGSEGFADMLGKFINEVDAIGAESGVAKEMF